MAELVQGEKKEKLRFIRFCINMCSALVFLKPGQVEVGILEVVYKAMTCIIRLNKIHAPVVLIDSLKQEKG